MKKFTDFVNEDTSIDVPEEKTITFCWGRFNPPTKGHEHVFNFAKRNAEYYNSKFMIFTSQTNDNDKNPLNYDQKIKILKNYFPEFNTKIKKNTDIRTFFDLINTLIEHNYTKGWLIVGEDRVVTFQQQIDKYFQGKANFEVVSAGSRDVAGEYDDETDIQYISGQMLRQFVKEGEFHKFKKGSPSTAKEKSIRYTYNLIREAYGLSPISNDIEPSREREEFYSGKFKIGDNVIKENVVGEIKTIGSNFLEVQFLGELKPTRVWPWQVMKI